MNLPFVDLKAQYESIRHEIDDAIDAVIGETAFIGGPFVAEFEKSFAEFCGVRHCVGVGNGTDALYIALKTLNVGPGDEVITAANSFIATSEAISLTGARVVFCDIDPQTYNIDATMIEAKISDKTRAIVPVHLFGQPADMDRILDLAKRHDIRVVEDAAQAVGATYRGRPAGSIGDVGCFSFYPGKNLGAYGDGGAIVTNDEDFARRARMFANHGRVAKYDHMVEGVNSRLDGLQAAILSVKLRHLPAWTNARRKAAEQYRTYLASTDVIPPTEMPEVEHVYHLYVVRVPAGIRDNLREQLGEDGVSTGVHYPIALPNLPAYRYLGHGERDFAHSTKASHEILSLPMFPELTEDQITYVCDRVNARVAALAQDEK